MKKFKSIQGDLTIDVYYDPESIPRNNAIFLGGFPVFPGPNILIEKLTKSGTIVFCPQYYGSFDSNGILTFRSMISTATDTAALIAQNQFNDAKSDYSPCKKTTVSLLAGHSFGGVVASYAAPSIPGLEQLLISSSGLLYSTSGNNSGLDEDFEVHLKNVRRTWRNTYRVGKLQDWTQITSGELPPQNDQQCTIRDAFVLIGGSDSYFDAEKILNSNTQVLMKLLGKKVNIRNHIVEGAGHAPNSIFNAMPPEDLGLNGLQR